jgi:transcriptional regulator with XRE-family HTH domain
VTATIINFADMVNRSKHLENPPNRIRELRLAAGLTQAELAEIIGVKPNVIGRYETGDRELSLGRMRQIARVFETDVGGLLSRDDNKGGLDDRELDVITIMRQDETRAEMVARLAETAQAFGQSPAEEKRRSG